MRSSPAQHVRIITRRTQSTKDTGRSIHYMDLSFHPGKPENFVFNFNSESSGLREAWGKTKFGELIEKPF